MTISRILHTPVSNTYFIYCDTRLTEVVTTEAPVRHAEVKALTETMTANEIAARAVVYTPKPVKS